MKNRSWIYAFGAILTLLSALAFLSGAKSIQIFGENIFRVSTNEKLAALTFDDGPTAKTDEVVKVLGSKGVKATFFVTGTELQRNMNEAKQLVMNGHQLGNHTYSHKRMVFKSPAYIKQEIERTDKLIRKAGYKGEIVFRPPYGKRLLLLPYYMEKQKRKTIMWDVMPESYPKHAEQAKQIIENAAATIKPGSIVLMHVMYKSGDESLKSLIPLITRLKSEGYRFVTVSELLKTGKLAGSNNTRYGLKE